MLKITRITTIYPAPLDEEGDYCPDGEAYVENLEMSFRGLVGMLSRGMRPSCWPATGAVQEWVTDEESQDYVTGDWTEVSLHFAHDNPPRAAKYWRYAWRAAGIVRA